MSQNPHAPQYDETIYTIGIDLKTPFCIYINGEVAAIYDDANDADKHYQQLLDAIKG